ncbi:MAG: TPM domain-containing protein [Johnsonella sp.]|nr:TPM domain-containing protein [Johnsonella sp.]
MLKIFSIFLFLLPLFSLSVSAENNRVFDHADVFESGQESEMNEEIAKAKDHIGMDIVIVTTEDAQGKTAEAYADDYYDYGDFGMGEENSGLLFLIDFDNREMHISTTGFMIRVLDDKRIDAMLDDAYAYMEEDDYAGAASSIIENAVYYFDKGVKGDQYNYDRDTGEISVYKKPKKISLAEFLLAMILPAAAGLRFTSSVQNQYKMKKEKKLGSLDVFSYRKACNFNYAVKEDEHLGRQTMTRIIADNSRSSGGGSFGGSRSTTHRSSSGTSHGGGGRKF